MKIRTGFNLLPISYIAIATVVFAFAWNISMSLEKSINFLIGGSIESRVHLDRAYVAAVNSAKSLQLGLPEAQAQQQLEVSKEEFAAFQKAFAVSFTGTEAQNSALKTRDVMNNVWRALDTGVQSAQRNSNYDPLPIGRAMYALSSQIDSLQQVYAVEHQRVMEELKQERFMKALVFALGMLALVALSLFVLLAMRRTLFRPLEALSLHFEHMAKGDFSSHASYSAKNELGAIFDSVQKMQDSVSTIMREVHAGIGEVGKNTELLSNGSTDLSVRTEQQSAALGETASSMQELSSTVTQNADNARQANELASSAHAVASKGGEIMSSVITRMSGISDNSIKISDIVSMIESIAFQTNILALNAAVEAARAGEQGKGFAVVAGEVRNLASRSAEAAKEIKALIETAVRDVADGNKLVEDAGKTMGEIVASVSRVASIMGEISSATHEQSRGISQINQAVGQMDEVTHRNALLVQETNVTVNHLKTSVTRVNEAIALLRIQDAQTVVSAPRRVQRDNNTTDRNEAPTVLAAVVSPALVSTPADSAVAKKSVARETPKTITNTVDDTKAQEIVSPVKKGTTSSEGEWDSF